MLIFPVRHHSPAAARHLQGLLRDRRPRVVLIEGPADADHLLPYLVDHATVPPVAIYAYPADRFTSEPSSAQREESNAARGRSVFYPLCHYSPELVAIRVGAEIGAEVRFCDLPARVSLTTERSADVEPEEHEDPGIGPRVDGYGQFMQRLAESAGFARFDAFWEATFEQAGGAGTVDDLIATFAAYGATARQVGAQQGLRAYDDLRERYMAGVARMVIRNGIPSEQIVLVCGAAHAEAIASYVHDGGEIPALGDEVETELALVPYSYPRLSEQLGYGAGNRAPWFYQQVWRSDGDYDAASRDALIAVARRLRREGQVASLAQEIDATDLARALASLRGKLAPGVDEVMDAAVACFGQGKEAVVTAALEEVLIGQELGQVTPFAGRTPLQTEFYATAQRLGLPVVDAPRQVLVHLPVPNEAAQSTLLHRLVAANIPFGQELQSGIGGRGQAAQGGPLAGLGRALEKWQLCWTPATDAALIERNAWGSTLAEVCTRLLRSRLDRAARIDEGTSIVLQLALCDLIDPFAAALERCETLAADSGSFPSLARAVFHLSGLLDYGAARKLPRERLTELTERLFVRATLHLSAAVGCADEAAAEIEQTLMPLADLVRKGTLTQGAALFWEAIEAVAELGGCHPGLRGLALTLLEIEGRLPAGELARRLRRWLAGGDPAANARLVAGIFSLHRGQLIRNQALLGAVTDFLTGLEIEALIPLLPALRRSLGNLSAAERRYLAEALGGVFGLDRAPPVTLDLSALERALVQEADASVAATIAGWRERYGIG